MRVGFLLLVAAALLLLWLVVGWRGGVDPRSYEVEYAVVATYEAATGRRVVEVARWVLGVGEENYTEFRRLTAMSEYTLYAATERGRIHTNLGRVYTDLPRNFPAVAKPYPFIRLPPGGVEAGACEHLGLRGVVYRYDAVAVSLPDTASTSGGVDVCVWRGVVLWMRIRDTYGVLWVNATYLRPYDNFRYRHILSTVKRYSQ
ncbi:MAG: hypothetical protein AT708_03155 [Pyrobaculum sp. OCT_11]|jgi:hypothetical protein|nr:MAG: hypothetical protein AT708_03155 [Pyrobaculum sp. OCT_11]